MFFTLGRIQPSIETEGVFVLGIVLVMEQRLVARRHWDIVVDYRKGRGGALVPRDTCFPFASPTVIPDVFISQASWRSC